MILAFEVALKKLFFFILFILFGTSSSLEPGTSRRGYGGVQQMLCFFTAFLSMTVFPLHTFWNGNYT